MKAAYKWIVKEHFPRIKKHADFQEQIIRHSTRQTKTNAMAMEEPILHGQTKPVTAASQRCTNTHRFQYCFHETSTAHLTGFSETEPCFSFMRFIGFSLLVYRLSW